MDLQRIKDIPILEIAGRLGLDLKAGKNNPCFKGHGKNTPCLHVYGNTNSFKCFSCGIGGTGIDLVMQCLNIDTAGAINWIKTQYGIQDTYKHPTGRTGRVFTGTLRGNGYKTTSGADKTLYGASMHVLNDIKKPIIPDNGKKDGREYAEIYRAFLDILPRKEAAEYLKNRGLTADIILESDIRAIPKDFDSTPLKDRYGIDTLLNAGLFAISKSGKPYPVFFSHRLIIPYFDTDGETILTLQGRNIDTKEEPKYKFLSGIKIPVYNLRGIADAEQNGKKVYITEGVIDCLSCYKAGMFHPLAIGGAMNKAIYEPEIFNRLGNLEIIIATDRDKAGQTFYRDFLKRYKDIFLTLPKVIDWDRIQGAKDLNEALTAEIIPEQKTEKKKYRSEIIGDVFTIEDNGGILFESGVYYTPAELEKVKGLTDTEKKTMHLLKKEFQGTIQ